MKRCRKGGGEEGKDVQGVRQMLHFLPQGLLTFSFPSPQPAGGKREGGREGKA